MKRLTANQYARALVAAYHEAPAKDRSKIVSGFFQFLIRRRAMKLLSRIMRHVQALQDEKSKTTRVSVWSANPIDIKSLSAALDKTLGKTVIDAQTDPALLGGLRIQIGDTQIDGTLRNRLNRLQTQLTTR